MSSKSKSKSTAKKTLQKLAPTLQQQQQQQQEESSVEHGLEISTKDSQTTHPHTTVIVQHPPPSYAEKLSKKTKKNLKRMQKIVEQNADNEDEDDDDDYQNVSWTKKRKINNRSTTGLQKPRNDTEKNVETDDEEIQHEEDDEADDVDDLELENNDQEEDDNDDDEETKAFKKSGAKIVSFQNSSGHQDIQLAIKPDIKIISIMTKIKELTKTSSEIILIYNGILIIFIFIFIF